MASTKRKAVISTEKAQLDRVQRLIEDGHYRTLSELMREAVSEKLDRIHQSHVANAVARYCTAGHAEEDLDLIDARAFEGPK